MRQTGASVRCPNCGTMNSASDQFCSNCGYALNNVGSTQTVIGSSYNAPSTANTIPAGRRMTGALQPQTLIDGRYRIVGLVGKGGFGAVYEAADEHFQGRRTVAVKEMSDAQLSPSERVQALQDFRREADLLVPLSHPNLPNVSDFFEEAGKAYLVMEFIQGKTLEKIQEDANAPLDERRVMGWALQLCDVLNYLHTQQPPIIFRDMKPSNVMVTKSDQIKLIDFGIARFFKSSARKDTTSLGSQGYAPLEQYGRGQSDARSDIYALGATLYDLLTHSLPADAPTRRVNPTLFERPHQLNPRISQATDNIVLKAMEEDPARRYQTAADMYQAILSSGIALPNTPHTLASMPIIAPAPTVPAQPSPASRQPAQPMQRSAQASTAGRVGQQPPQTPQAPPPPTQFAPAATPPARPVSRRGLLIGGAIAVGAAALGYSYLHRQSSNSGSSGSSGSSGGPIATGGAITVNFFFSTEKQAWLQAAIDTFNQSGAQYQNRQIQLVTSNSGSIDVADRIMSGQIQPTAWSPASDLELNRLSTMWHAAHSGQDIIITNGDLAATSLVSSPLVFAVWKERADALLRHYPSIDWPGLYSAFKLNSWSDLHESFSGPVKFGQTVPDKSNSGLLTITLIAYSALNKSRGLTTNDVNSSAYVNYLKVFENAVNEFGRSSGTYLNNVVLPNGPAQTDVVTTYENLVLSQQVQQQAQQRYNQPLLLFYPALNILSNHPFAIFQAPWIKPEEQAAAKQFRDFLLSVPMQQQAVQNGFRPGNSSVQIGDKSISNNPFSRLPTLSPKHTFDPQNDPRAFFPDGDVVNALIKVWQTNYPSPQLANG